MLVRVRGYNNGFANYLRTGQKNGNHLHRDDLDKRIILSGDLDITDEIVSAMPDKGDDRYLHIALPFKEDYIPDEVLKEVLDEFKRILMHAYNEDEYAFYAEAHIPKIKRVLNEKTGEMEDRKPHIHIVIPKVNLVDGSYLNPLGYYPHNEKYVEAMQEVINFKYGFASPRDNRRFNLTDISDFISRYKGDFFKSDVRSFKENLLSTVMSDSEITYGKFIEHLEGQGQLKIRNPGEKQYFNVHPDGFKKGVNLKDYVFSREFLDLPYEEKLNFITSNSYQRDDTKKKEDFTRDMSRQSEWLSRRSHEIKHFHPNSKEYRQYKKLTNDERQIHLNFLISSRQSNQPNSDFSDGNKSYNFQNLHIESMKGKYNVRRKAVTEKSGVHRHAGTGLFQRNSESTQGFSQYRVRKLQFGELDSSLYEQAGMFLQADSPVVLADRQRGVPTLMRYPIDRTDAGTGGRGRELASGQGKGTVLHESDIRFSVTVNAIRRSGDNYLESVRTDAADRILRNADYDKPDWQQIRSQLNGHELLKSLQHSHGIDIAKYSLTKSKNGEDRIRVGSRSYSVNDFLTKELNLNWQEASDYLRREHHRQFVEDRLNDFNTPSKNYWLRFKEWDKDKNLYSSGWKELREDQARQRTLLNKTFRQKSSAVWKENDLTFSDKKSNVAAIRLQKLKARQILQEQQKAERAKLKEALSTQNRFIEYLRLLAEEGDRQALKELRKVVKRHERQPERNYFESQVNTTSVLLEKVTYTVKNNGSVAYLIDNKEAVIDAREWISVVQNENDEAIELAIRLALEKNGYRPLTLNGDDSFIKNIVRVAQEKNIKLSFDNDEINREYSQGRDVISDGLNSNSSVNKPWN